MQEEEGAMSEEDQIRILAGCVRNYMQTATIFTPWVGLDLAYRDETLYRCTPNVSSEQRGYTPICSMWELHDATDVQICEKVMEGVVA